jgi:hypothetical protein
LREKSLQTVRQATVFVEKDGETYLAYWLQYRVSGKTKSMVAVMRPERLLLPRDGIGLGFKDSETDLTFEEMQRWLAGKGYRFVGEVVKVE